MNNNKMIVLLLSKYLAKLNEIYEDLSIDLDKFKKPIEISQFAKEIRQKMFGISESYYIEELRDLSNFINQLESDIDFLKKNSGKVKNEI